MVEHQFLDGRIAGVSIDKAIDSKTKPVLLFLHGFLDNAASFTYLLKNLASHNCIAIDLPGHGKSAHRSADAHYHLTDYVFDLHSLVQEQQWDRVCLVGHSLGGIICSIYAACFPENVEQVFSIESCGPLTEPEDTTCNQLRESINSRVKAKGQIKHPESISQIVDARMRISDLTAEQAECILQRNIQHIDGKLRWRTDKRLRTKSSIRFTHNQALNVVENIQCQYHVILGDKGFSKLKHLYQQRQSAFKQLSMRELEGGHHVHMNSPEALANYINDSLKN